MLHSKSSSSLLNPASRDYVVLLHCIAGNKIYMSRLARYLRKNNFEVINLNYPSTSYPIQDLIEIIHNKISKFTDKNKKIHFVGHSMGALVSRALLNKYNYKNLGRVVHLAPPNQGSELANFMKDFWLYKKILGPAAAQLVTDQTQFKELFGEVNYELGIIAGNRPLTPLFSRFISKENDGIISVASTKLNAAKDHIIIRASHVIFPFYKETQKQTLYFLINGCFDKS